MVHKAAGDEELMMVAATGSEAAFEEIVRRYQSRLLHVFALLGHDRESSRDLTQESFLRLLRAAPRYEPRARFSTFLFTIARRLSRDAHRHVWESRRLDLDEKLPSSGATERSLEVAELRARVDAVLCTLAPIDREVLVWSEIAGLSQREIAALLEIPEGTVASRKNRAVRQVRVRWKGELP